MHPHDPPEFTILQSSPRVSFSARVSFKGKVVPTGSSEQMRALGIIIRTRSPAEQMVPACRSDRSVFDGLQTTNCQHVKNCPSASSK